MSRVITYSRVFPSYHPRAGEPTYFVEKILRSQLSDEGILRFNSNQMILQAMGGYDITKLDLKPIEIFDPKHHTIRPGHRWKVGDWFSPRVWSGKPYNSKQIQFAPDIQIKKVWDFSIILGSICVGNYIMNGETEGHHELVERLAMNDGLTKNDLIEWIKYPKPFDGQIISWSDSINY